MVDSEETLMVEYRQYAYFSYLVWWYNYLLKLEVKTMVSIKEIAHYGRWFPYCKTDYDLWWFDKKKSQMIDAEKLGSVFDCDVHSLPSVIAQCYGHYVPCFRVDIPALEMKYAQVYLSRKTVKFLSQLSSEDMDREFLIAIEKEFLDTDWYRYELAHLSSAAEEWCKENHIRYTD